MQIAMGAGWFDMAISLVAIIAGCNDQLDALVDRDHIWEPAFLAEIKQVFQTGYFTNWISPDIPLSFVVDSTIYECLQESMEGEKTIVSFSL